MSPQSIHVLVPRTCDLFHRKRDTIKSRTRGGQYLPLGYLGHQCHHKGPSKGRWAGQSKMEAEGGGRHFRMEEERDQEPRDVGSF